MKKFYTSLEKLARILRWWIVLREITALMCVHEPQALYFFSRRGQVLDWNPVGNPGSLSAHMSFGLQQLVCVTRAMYACFCPKSFRNL